MSLNAQDKGCVHCAGVKEETKTAASKARYVCSQDAEGNTIIVPLKFHRKLMTNNAFGVGQAGSPMSLRAALSECLQSLSGEKADMKKESRARLTTKEAMKVNMPYSGDDITTLMNAVTFDAFDRTDNQYFSFSSSGLESTAWKVATLITENVLGHEFYPETADHIAGMIVNDQHISGRYFKDTLRKLDELSDMGDADVTDFEDEVELLGTIVKKEAKAWVEDIMYSSPLEAIEIMSNERYQGIYNTTMGVDPEDTIIRLVKNGTLEVDWASIREEMDGL